MHERGFGRRRGVVIMALALMLAVATPEIAAPAGAVAVRSTGRAEMQARPTAHAALVARRRRRVPRRSSAARRRAQVLHYMKTHHGLVLQHLKAHPELLAEKLKARPALLARFKKKVAQRLAKGKGAKPAKKKAPAVKKKAKKKKTKAKKKGAKPKRAAKPAAAKKKKSKSHPLGMTGWTELLLLALLPFGAAALVLVGTDLRRRPRVPSARKRRRTLVITPLGRNR